MERTILYYPKIKIPHDNWLKKSIIFWDHISSIVPDKNYYQRNIPDLHEDVRYLIDNNIYTPVYPSKLFESQRVSDFNTELEKEFSKFLFSLQKSQGQTSLHKGKIDKADFSERQIRVHREKLLFPDLASKVHYRKFDDQFYEFLLEHGFIADYGDEWVSMDERLSTLYMSLMAKYLSNLSTNPTVVGTDKNKYLYFAYSRTYRSKNNLAYNVCFQNALPEPSPDVPLKKIIEFKQRRQLELNEFQYELLQFENKLSRCLSSEEANSELELFKKKLEKSVLELERIYKDERINYILGTIKSLVETGGGALAISSAAQLPTWANILALGSGGLLGFGYSFLQHKKALNQTRQTNGFAYLYDLYNYNMIRK